MGRTPTWDETAPEIAVELDRLVGLSAWLLNRQPRLLLRRIGVVCDIGSTGLENSPAF
jgi:hypothetical protein